MALDMRVYNNQFQNNLENNKTREFGTPYSRNATLTQINRTMKREGKKVTTYTSNKAFQAFFRMKDDNENQKETIILTSEGDKTVYSHITQT